ncbi:hypothetical protein [Mesorhizobium sp. B2-6-7]|nr:hypothetical protein [Mesorhizobium sp. B2-6-7]
MGFIGLGGEISICLSRIAGVASMVSAAITVHFTFSADALQRWP